MATKTSASAFNSFFYQQQQQHQQQQQQPQQQSNPKQMDSMSNQNNGEQVSDLHLKMSKKIAQLTKVIYALNSKNDESENLIANLKAQFDEEKEQLLLETNKKLEEYKHKLINDSDQTKKIAALEAAIKEYQKQKEKALSEYEELKLKSIETEENLTLSHKQELIDMNRMLEQLKIEQEKQFRQFEALNKKYETEKLYLIEDLKSKHRIEIDNLKQSFNSNKDTFQVEKRRLEEKHESEILKIKSELEVVQSKSNQEKLDYDQNIMKLKAFHEKELEAHKQNSSNEYLKLINNLKADMETLNNQKISMEKELNSRYNSKLEEIVSKDEEIELLKKQIAGFEQSLQESNQNILNLNDKVLEITALNQKLETKLVEIEMENSSNKERCDSLSRTILEKSSENSVLEAANMQMTSTISDLKTELALTKDRLDLLENERRSIENQSLSQNDKNLNTIKSLEKQLEALNNEKQTLTTDFDKKFSHLSESNTKLIEKLKLEAQTEKEQLIDKYESKLNTEKTIFEEKLLTLERNLNNDFSSENQRILNERNELKAQLDKLLEELKIKTKKYDTELKNLTDELKKTQLNLTNADSSNKTLTETNKQLKIEYDSIKVKSNEQKLRIDELTSELEQVKFLHETTSKDSQLELRVKLEKLNKELNAKWSETLRVECDNLRLELQKTKEEEKRREIEQLTNLKDEEIRNLKAIWQAKTNELLEEISTLKQELSEKELLLKDKFENVKSQLEAENRAITEKYNKLNEEFNSRIEGIESTKNLETKQIIEKLIKENEDKISELKTRHLEDLKSQTIAQKAAISGIKASMENSKALELEVQQQAHNKKLEIMKYEIEQSYYNELDKLRNENEAEMHTVRAELEKATETVRQKDREIEIKTDDFQSELRVKQKLMDRLNEDIKELKFINNSLKDEIDVKTKEIKQIKNDVQIEIRNREQIALQRKEEEVNRLNSEHMKQKQLLVNEFKQAQEILKDKIIELENDLRIMHDRYMNRESREEDLEQIKNLKRIIAEKEELLKKYLDEKRYFQMELVNRENNFNKMFNAAPNVGFINPLTSATKVKPKTLSNLNLKSSPQPPPLPLPLPLNHSQLSGGRLEPIPGVGSPLHDLPLNPNKPLPKKFLS